MYNIRDRFPILNVESKKISVKLPNIKIQENPYSSAQAVMREQTDR
jgi:hypothetical protein